MQQRSGLPPFDLPSDHKEQNKAISERYNHISIYSKKLQPARQRYAATERECLGVKEAFKKYHRELIIRSFDGVGDCRPIQAIWALSSCSKNKKILRWKGLMSAYSFIYHHREGVGMVVADYLSRMALPTTNTFSKSEDPKAEKAEIQGILRLAAKLEESRQSQDVRRNEPLGNEPLRNEPLVHDLCCISVMTQSAMQNVALIPSHSSNHLKENEGDQHRGYQCRGHSGSSSTNGNGEQYEYQRAQTLHIEADDKEPIARRRRCKQGAVGRAIRSVSFNN